MIRKKVLFFGTPQIAVRTLEKLESLSTVEIVGVGVFPDKKVGRKHVLTPNPVKEKAQELRLPLLEIKTKDDLVSVFEKYPCDMALVIAFGMIFPQKVLEIPPFGVVNIHFSLLPMYRGASPVQSALLHGDSISGITFQRMVAALDAGDVLYQKPFSIENKKTSAVFEDFSYKAAEMLPVFLERFFGGLLIPRPQDRSDVTLCGKFEKKDGEVFPHKETATEIYRKYLAFDVFPGVFLSTTKGALKLKDIFLHEHPNSFTLSCAENTKLFIHKAQLPGKKEMLMNDILRGHPGLLSAIAHQ